MFGSHVDTSRSRFGEEMVVIAMFAYASDARRALHTLHEHHFAAEQLAAAFRESPPARKPKEDPSDLSLKSGKWFGQLRQIYRGNDAPVSQNYEATSGENTTGFEAMLSQIDLSPEETQMLNSDLDRGAALVIVRAGARNQEAKLLLEQRGARIIHGQRSTQTAAIEPSGETVIGSEPFVSPPATRPDHIQLFGEVLRVHKEKVSAGDVQVRKEAVTRMETVQVPVTREHLIVEQTDGTGAIDEQKTLRVPLSEERVHIDKDTVLREEYKVGKRQVTQNESVSDTVRRERLLIDDGGQDE